MKTLNRISRTIEQGFELEADLRHAEIIVKQLGLENAKSLTNLLNQTEIIQNPNKHTQNF